MIGFIYCGQCSLACKTEGYFFVSGVKHSKGNKAVFAHCSFDADGMPSMTQCKESLVFNSDPDIVDIEAVIIGIVEFNNKADQQIFMELQ